VKPYRDVQFKYKNKLIQIQIWGHPERALLLTTPLDPPDLLLDALPYALIEGLSEALVEKFCLDPLHLIFLFDLAPK
jgi:hypothetical protein